MRLPRGAASASRIASRRTSTTRPRTKGENTTRIRYLQCFAATVASRPLWIGVGQVAEDRGEVI